MCSELPTANTSNCSGALFSVVTHVTLHQDHFIWWQASWCFPLFLFAVSCPDVTVDCTTVNMRFLFSHIVYGFGIGFLWLMYTHYIYQHVHCMLRFCWWRWECYILHAFIHIIFRVRFITMYVILPYAMCVILVMPLAKALSQKGTELFSVWAVVLSWGGECKFSYNGTGIHKIILACLN